MIISLNQSIIEKNSKIIYIYIQFSFESEDIIENYYNLYLWDGICIHSNIH